MAFNIPTMRYWRIIAFRTRSGTWQDTVMRWRTLAFADSAGVALSPPPTVTESGAGGIADGVLGNLVDGNSATTVGMYMYLYSGYLLHWGNCTLNYDYGSPVKPEKLLVSYSADPVNGSGSGVQIPYYLNEISYYIYASEDNVNWQQVTILQSLGGSFDTTYTASFDIIRPFRYNYDTVMPFSGDGGIYGIVAEDGTPVQRPVILFEREGFTPIRRMISTVDGAYSFENLNRDREYLVMAVDTTEEPGQPGEYKNALVRDRITPIPANGLPTDGLEWFFRLRSTMKPRPACAFNFYGPATNAWYQSYGGVSYPGYNTNSGVWVDTAAGGGFDLRGIPLPVSRGLRLAYPRCNYPDCYRGPTSPITITSAFSTEAIFEVPSGSDKSLVFSYSGVLTGGIAQAWSYQHGLTVEVTNAGVLNVRACFTSSQDLNVVRATTNVTPGSVVHLVLCYSEGQYIKVYVNGALAVTGSLTGLGLLFGSVISTTGTWNTYGDAAYVGGPYVYKRAFQTINHFMVHASPMQCNAGFNDLARLDSGFAWAAIYAGDLSLTPDAGGVPIAVRDLYSTYASGAVWTGGARPNGWPTSPEFSGYGVEVAADAPSIWMRMQETANSQMAVGYGLQNDDITGWYTGTGVTFSQPGMTAGMSSVAIGSNGALRVFGQRETDVWPHSNTVLGPSLNGYEGTAELWYRPAALSLAKQTLLYTINHDNTVNDLWMYVDTAGRVSIRLRDNSNNTQTFTFTSAVLTAGNAYHIAITWDCVITNRVKLYINGTMVEQQNMFTLLHARSVMDGLTIGNALTDPDVLPPYNGTVSGSTEYANGDIADVALYSYALSADRIAAHYAARNI